jgi:hypothetical protein
VGSAALDAVLREEALAGDVQAGREPADTL